MRARASLWLCAGAATLLLACGGAEVFEASASSIALQVERQDAEVVPALPELPGRALEPWSDSAEWNGEKVFTLRRLLPDGDLRRVQSQLTSVEGPRGHQGRDLDYYSNGVVAREAFWEKGLQEGLYREWGEGGDLRKVAQYQGGVPHGPYTEYDEFGTRIFSAHYREGRLHGKLEQWFTPDQPQEISHWKDGVQVGRHRLWDRGRVPLILENYEDGRRHGLALEFHRQPGPEKPQFRGMFDSGQRQGVWQEFDLEGRVIGRYVYAHGELNGAFEQWKDGVKVLATEYKKGLETGARREFYPDGRAFAEGVMREGRREGPWRYWKEDGSLDSRWSGVYAKDQKVSELEAGSDD